MTTVKQFIEENPELNVEVWKFKDTNPNFQSKHTDSISYLETYEALDMIVLDDEHMDAEDYNHTIYANSCECADEDTDVTILWVDGSAPVKIKLIKGSTSIILPDNYRDKEEAMREVETFDFASWKEYAGGQVVVLEYDSYENVYEECCSSNIPEAYNGRPERYSFISSAEAEEKAEELTPEYGYTEYGRADCDNMPCPRELDSWSGEIAAINVYNYWDELVAIIGYWE